MAMLSRVGMRSTAFTGRNQVIGSTVGAPRSGRTASNARATRRVQAAAQVPAPVAQAPALANTRAVAVVPARAPSAPASTKKVEKTVNKTFSGPGLYDRVCTTRNLVIGGAVVSSAAVAAAFYALSTQVGTLAASQMLATGTVAFLQPGMAIFGFAVKTGVMLTVNTVVPVTGGIVAVTFPFVSLALSTAIPVILVCYLFMKLEAKLEDGMIALKDHVIGIPGRILRNVPGVSLVNSMLRKCLIIEEPAVESKAARLERNRNEIEKANRDTGAMAVFEKELEDAKTPKQRAAAQRALATLRGERILQWEDAPAPRGLAGLLDQQPAPRAGVYTRQMYLQAKAAKEANGEVV